MIDLFLVTSLDGVTRAFTDRGAFVRAGSSGDMSARFPDAQHITMIEEESQGVRVSRANAKNVADKIAAHKALVEAEAREEAERNPVDPYANDANPENIAEGDEVIYRPTFGGAAVHATVRQNCPANGGVLLSAGGVHLGGVGYANVRLLRRAKGGVS